MSSTTVRCEDCHRPIPGDTNAAIGVLYCGGGLPDLADHLSDVLAEGRSDDDEAMLREGLTRWLGFPPTALVAAVRHVELEARDDH